MSVLIRLPGGSRIGRRFLKSDALQVGGAAQTGSALQLGLGVHCCSQLRCALTRLFEPNPSYNLPP